MSLQAPSISSAVAQREIGRRRTFAIISHPDAGKTTLTEKFLLYGGAVQLAGSIKAKKNQRATTSDWMELEKQRGISVSSTVLQFEYNGCCVNLLDTPGHKDFSEDTYRVLSAVDAAIMVIDGGKGIESQTRKLFEVCRQRGVPIFTFMNKMDRSTRPPLELCDELESVLGIHACPLNWPLGDGAEFKGIFDRQKKEFHLFEKTPQGAYAAPLEVKGIEDESVRSILPPDVYQRVRHELELLDGAGAEFDVEQIRLGKISPVFFGSAANNFGIQFLLDRFLELAPPPAARRSIGGMVEPTAPGFSGFVFKIQANMNPKHRDRITFIRIVSGLFERDMNVTNQRSGKLIRLSNSQRLFAQERETVNEAWAGDIVGIIGNHDFQIGDTLSIEPGLEFQEIPRFAPECFASLHNTSTAKYKRFREGLEQLLKEGVAQAFDIAGNLQRVPLLGAVGSLQYDVLKFRLESEYGAECRVEMESWQHVRWIRVKKDQPADKVNAKLDLPSQSVEAIDAYGAKAVLFTSPWSIKYFEDQNPAWETSKVPFKP